MAVADENTRNVLLEDVRKRFKQISEYNFYVDPTLNEDDGNDPLPDEPEQGAPAGEDQPQDAPQQDGGNEIPFEDEPQGAEGDGNGAPDEGEPEGPKVQGAPGPDMPEPEPEVNLDEPGSEDTVLDVDDLTNAQEKLNDKINSVGRDLGAVNQRIADLGASIDKIISAIDANNASIQSLSADLNNRLPSEEQKLDVRYQKSGPFNEKPDEYFAQAMKDNPNYQITDGEKEYTLTEKDLETNPATIRDSFRVTEDMKFSLKDAFNATKG